MTGTRSEEIGQLNVPRYIRGTCRMASPSAGAPVAADLTAAPGPAGRILHVATVLR
jgi:hypothetical protein